MQQLYFVAIGFILLFSFVLSPRLRMFVTEKMVLTRTNTSILFIGFLFGIFFSTITGMSIPGMIIVPGMSYLNIGGSSLYFHKGLLGVVLIPIGYLFVQQKGKWQGWNPFQIGHILLGLGFSIIVSDLDTFPWI